MNTREQRLGPNLIGAEWDKDGPRIVQHLSEIRLWDLYAAAALAGLSSQGIHFGEREAHAAQSADRLLAERRKRETA